MRDYLFASIILASIPVGLIRPYYGVLIYAWISYMNPHLLTWSFARTLPVAKLAGISTLIGVVLHSAGDPRPLRQRENILMIVLWLIFTLSSSFAFYPDEAWLKWQEVSKIILMALLTSTMLTEPKRLRAFFLVVAFSLGFYGAKGGVFGLLTGGGEQVLGPGDSIIGGNNALGLALNMCLPLLWYLAKNPQPVWLKWMLRLSFFLTIPAIMFTYARASTLGLGAVLLSIILKGRRKILTLSLMLVIGILGVNYLPTKWSDRQRSTLEYEKDSSAMSRLGEWELCWRVALDRPLTGGGFMFYATETFARYYPEFLETFGKNWNSHSIYYGMLGAHGFPGLLVFLSMIGLSLRSLWRIKRAVYDRPDLQWLINYSDMLQVSWVGFLVNGAFVNMEYFDLVYHWIGVIATLKVLAHQELLANNASPPMTDSVHTLRSKSIRGSGRVSVG